MWKISLPNRHKFNEPLFLKRALRKQGKPKSEMLRCTPPGQENNVYVSLASA
jgi:hypothetical protein